MVHIIVNYRAKILKIHHTWPWLWDHRNLKTRSWIQNGQDLEALVCDAAYQQTESTVWIMLQALTELSADFKLKIWYCTKCWFVHLERGRKTLQHSFHGDGNGLKGKSLYQLQSKEVALFGAQTTWTLLHLTQRVPELNNLQMLCHHQQQQSWLWQVY